MKSFVFACTVSLVLFSQDCKSCLDPSGIGTGVDDVYQEEDLSLPGNIFVGLVLQGVNGALGQTSFKFYETPIQLRMAAYQGILLYQTLSSYDDTAIEFFARESVTLERRICQPIDTSEDDTTNSDYFDLHRKVSLAYAYYYLYYDYIKVGQSVAEELMLSYGLNPNICIENESNCADLSTPWGLTWAISKELREYAEYDGWNADGSYNRDYNKIPYSDYRDSDSSSSSSTKYTPVNDPWYLSYENRWQPLLESDELGFLYNQEHVVPHIGYTGKSFIFDESGDNNEFCEWRELSENYIGDANYDYNYEIELLFERMNNLDNNNELKMDIEYFDDKNVLLALHGQYQGRQGNSPDGLYHTASKLVLQLAWYEATLQVWKAKVDFDRVRPPSIIRKWFQGQDITTYAGVDEDGYSYNTQTFDGSNFDAYIRTMPHAEYPSASACICEAGRTGMIEFSGTDNITQFIQPGLIRSVEAYSSIKEPNSTPDESYTVIYDTWSELFNRCGDSRLDGGMHFTESVTAGRKLCSNIGIRVAQTIRNLLNGDKPQYVNDVTNLDLIERDCKYDDDSDSDENDNENDDSTDD